MTRAAKSGQEKATFSLKGTSTKSMAEAVFLETTDTGANIIDEVESIWSMTIRNFSGLFQEMAEYFLRMTYMTMLWKRIKATHRGSLNPLQTPRNLNSS